MSHVVNGQSQGLMALNVMSLTEGDREREREREEEGGERERDMQTERQRDKQIDTPAEGQQMKRFIPGFSC